MIDQPDDFAKVEAYTKKLFARDPEMAEVLSMIANWAWLGVKGFERWEALRDKHGVDVEDVARAARSSTESDPWIWFTPDRREKKLAAALSAWEAKQSEAGGPNSPEQLRGLLEVALRAAFHP